MDRIYSWIVHSIFIGIAPLIISFYLRYITKSDYTQLYIYVTELLFFALVLSSTSLSDVNSITTSAYYKEKTFLRILCYLFKICFFISLFLIAPLYGAVVMDNLNLDHSIQEQSSVINSSLALVLSNVLLGSVLQGILVYLNSINES